MCRLPNVKNAAQQARDKPAASETRRFLENNGKIELAIDGKWYDVTKWAEHHPGGKSILETVSGQDVTDVFYSLHTEEAVQRLKKMSASKSDAPIPEQPSYVKSFREFRASLVTQGFFKRNYVLDVAHISMLPILAILGTMLAWTYPVISTILLAVCMQQSGWIGHDYCHGTDSFSRAVRFWVSCPINAFERKWWVDKHNGLHHAFVNLYELDEDLQNEPVFYLFARVMQNGRVKDSTFRRYQHLYFWPVVGFLYISWRIQSLQSAVAHRNWKELAAFAVNYAWLLSLPWYVALGSIFFGGWLVGIVVTASHQAEPIVSTSDVSQYDFVGGTFLGTCDAVTRNFVEEYLWGGMQYQLEHHLFPTMPRYNYSRVAPLVAEWAKKAGLEYKAEDSLSLILRNVEHLSSIGTH
eukprot:NODE_1240_length_1411_cov_707.616822_g1229_i0.p1 GENE.NODE_1240_length_1411_cov_707.616822_g1229_i0~~NODE_1240_length_1411_cov_707.616822_g1229_i0.p1  ORF type:complete len:410 (+),score=70.30 NODE_1240_length_1411_cov_707.616822_g1229_i0:103-1332(+)